MSTINWFFIRNRIHQIASTILEWGTTGYRLLYATIDDGGCLFFDDLRKTARRFEGPADEPGQDDADGTA
jgi:hypothetical protein